MNVNTQTTLEAFAKLSGLNTEEVLSKFINEPAFSLYEKGQISDVQFRELVLNVFNLKIADKDINEAWNAMIFDIPAHRLDWLSSLNENYNVYILSNTNNVHIDYVHEELKSNHGLSDFSTLVKEVYYSHEVAMRKPDEEIFRWVLDKNNLLPEQTIFLDDNAENIIEAKRIGITSLLVNNPEDVPELLKNEGIEI